MLRPHLGLIHLLISFENQVIKLWKYLSLKPKIHQSMKLVILNCLKSF